MEEKIEKIYKIILVILAIVSVDLIITVVTINKGEGTKETKNNTETKEKSDYDVSSFKQVDLSGALKLFENKNGNSIVYLGRETCSACVTFVPILKEAQEKYDLDVYYLDITTVNTKSDEFEKFKKKLDKEVTITVSGEETTKSYGEYYGYTPMTFIIKNGKFKDGIVGAYSLDKLSKFLSENGIK